MKCPTARMTVKVSASDPIDVVKEGRGWLMVVGAGAPKIPRRSAFQPNCAAKLGQSATTRACGGRCPKLRISGYAINMSLSTRHLSSPFL